MNYRRGQSPGAAATGKINLHGTVPEGRRPRAAAYDLPLRACVPASRPGCTVREGLSDGAAHRDPETGIVTMNPDGASSKVLYCGLPVQRPLHQMEDRWQPTPEFLV